MRPVHIEALIVVGLSIKRFVALVDEGLNGLDSHLDELCVKVRRWSIPPERLLKTSDAGDRIRFFAPPSVSVWTG